MVFITKTPFQSLGGGFFLICSIRFKNTPLGPSPCVYNSVKNCSASSQSCFDQAVSPAVYLTFLSKILSEIYFEVRAEGEVGSMKLDYSTPIKKNGSTGKSKFIKKDLRGDKDFQNEFKPYVNAFKAVGDMLFTEASRNPEYGKPLSNISFDGRQTFKTVYVLFSKFPDIPL